MRKRTWWRVAVNTGGVVAGILTMIQPAAGATPSSLQLSVAASAGTFTAGSDVPLYFVVTNQSSVACDLEAAPDGAVHIVTATLNGQPIVPTIEKALVVGGSTAGVTGARTTVAPRASARFTLTGTDPIGFSLLTPTRDHAALLSSWSTHAVGTYRFELLYQASPLLGATACASTSNMSTVSFTVSPKVAVAPTSSSHLWIFIVAAVVIVLIVVLVVVLLLRRRGRGAVAAAIVLALTAGALGGVVARAPAARADVTFINLGNPGDPAAVTTFGGCMATIGRLDPGLLNDLNGPHSPNVRVYPISQSLRSDLPDGGPLDSLIGWAWKDKSPIPGDPGVNYDPCSSLYHELVHAEDAKFGRLSDAYCGDSDVYNDEIKATLVENIFRAAQHNPDIKQRTNYDGVKLPKQLSACMPQSSRPRQIPYTTVRHCDTSCAISTGDPHMTTFDGGHYDFQGAGEFTAVTSTADDMTVQVRQQPAPGSTNVAFNTAVAVGVQGTKLGFYLINGVVEVHRDGALVTLPQGTTPLTNGATISPGDDPYSGSVYDITWSDGSMLEVRLQAPWGIGFTLSAATSRAGTLSGLLGDDNGDPSNDIVPAGGGAPITPSFTTLYPAYADSWRITRAASLFDYDAGQSTATYTDETFPTAPATASAASMAACAAAGVTDPVALADCAIDVATTGDAGTAVTAADGQALVTGGTPTPVPAPTPSPTPNPSGSTTTSGATMTRTITIANPGDVGKVIYTGRKDERLYVWVISTTFTTEDSGLTLREPDGNPLVIGCLNPHCDLIGTSLYADGQYPIIVDPAGNDTGTVTLGIAGSADKTTVATINGPPLTLSVDTPGQWVRANFTLKAGQKISIKATGATLPDSCDVLEIVTLGNANESYGCLNQHVGQVSWTADTAGDYSLFLRPPTNATGQVTVVFTSP